MLRRKKCYDFLGLVLCFLLSCTSSELEAQTSAQSAGNRSYSSALIPRDSASLEIVLGRLQLAQSRFRIHRKHEQAEPGNGFSRSIGVSAENGRPALHFLQKDATECWRIVVDATSEVIWTRDYVSHHGKTSVSYAQPATGDIAITIQAESLKQKYELQAHSLWHLAAECPAGFLDYVVPCLERLDPTWDFTEAITNVNITLKGPLNAQTDSIDASVQGLVDQLGASQFAQRNAARMRLEAIGLTAWIPLEKSLQKRLSAEQRRSVEGLFEFMRPHSPDAPTRVALWLRGDSEYCRHYAAH